MDEDVKELLAAVGVLLTNAIDRGDVFAPPSIDLDALLADDGTPGEEQCEQWSPDWWAVSCAYDVCLERQREDEENAVALAAEQKKLFVSWDGSDPDVYEGSNLGDCLANLLQTIDADDENLQFLIDDIHTFVADEPDEDGRLKKKFSTAMFCSAQWCYGYESMEQAFNEDVDESGEEE